MNKIEQLIELRRNQRNMISVRMNLNGNYIRTPYVPAWQCGSMVCNLISRKMGSLVCQRKRQIEMGYYHGNPDELYRSISILEYRLASRHRWNAKNLHRYVGAALPDLEYIAPRSGKYAPLWKEFLIGLELIRDEHQIEQKIQKLIAHA